MGSSVLALNFGVVKIGNTSVNSGSNPNFLKKNVNFSFRIFFLTISKKGLDLYEYKGYLFTIEPCEKDQYKGFMGVMSKCQGASFVVLDETKKLCKEKSYRAIDALIEYNRV